VENTKKIVAKNLDQLPSNIEAEQALIGSILINNDVIDETSQILNTASFYDPAHQKIYDVIKTLNNKGMVANPITLKNFFEKDNLLKEVGGVEYLVKLTRFSSSVRQAIDYAKIIQENYLKRELIHISKNLSEVSIDKNNDISADKIIEDTEKSLFDLAERGTFSQSFIKFNVAIDQTIEMATKALKNDKGIVGVPTGLKDLDEKMGGLHNSDLIIIAGRPSMGKTALATNIAYHASKNFSANEDQKSSVAFFSLEMSSEQLSTRILSEQSRIKSNDIRRGKITEEELNRYIETSREIYNLPLYIDETPAITIATLSNRARRMKRLFGLNLIVVDYIQLMRSNNSRFEGRVQEISEITQGLKALAKELNVPVIALSQLSRAVEQRDDKLPQLSDLRESGSIEQDADVVLFVYREEYYLEKRQPKLGTIEHAEWQSKMNDVSGLADIIIGKQRHGPTGNINVEFEGMYTKFKDLTKNSN
tara:strand:- start:2190 stop:3623 length:1434 start_codon:yes stop_codon:yes gene_type:complete